MTRILAVDDSRAIRAIVAKQVREFGWDVDEAEDGEQGLAHLEECNYDLILLDVTMPVLDGPGMLARMREAGNQTPVLMLTSESKRSIVAGVMKLGIEDYILKPWKPEELAAKMKKILKCEANPAAIGGGGDSTAHSSPQISSAGPDSASPSGGKQFIDVLLVDDMENVQKKLRQMLPPHVTLSACVSAQSAISLCREKIFRVVLVDTDIPDVDSSVLLGQLRAQQGAAAFLALTLRTSNNALQEARDKGFDAVMFKPFDKDSIDDFLLRYFDNQELVTAEDSVLKVSAFTGKDEALDKYFGRLRGLLEPLLTKVASACFEHAILDISQMPARPDKMPKLILQLDTHAKKAGVELRVVGTPESGKLLTGFSDTACVPFFNSIAQANG